MVNDADPPAPDRGLQLTAPDAPAPHASRAELEAGLEEVLRAPKDDGRLELIVRRPKVGAREVLESGVLDLEQGLVGDDWATRGSRLTADGRAHPDMQLNLMNARAAQLVAGRRERWALAGDQLYLDLDLSAENLPPGSRLGIGEAIIEITAEPHLGCKKFVSRFGRDAMRFVNSERGRRWNLRGVNARVERAGLVRTGDRVRKLGRAAAVEAAPPEPDRAP